MTFTAEESAMYSRMYAARTGKAGVVSELWDGPDTSLQGRYDDDRMVMFEPSLNYEIAIRVGNQTPVFVDALDLLRVVSHVALDIVHDPSETERFRRERLENEPRD